MKSNSNFWVSFHKQKQRTMINHIPPTAKFTVSYNIFFLFNSTQVHHASFSGLIPALSAFLSFHKWWWAWPQVCITLFSKHYQNILINYIIHENMKVILIQIIETTQYLFNVVAITSKYKRWKYSPSWCRKLSWIWKKKELIWTWSCKKINCNLDTLPFYSVNCYLVLNLSIIDIGTELHVIK